MTEKTNTVYMATKNGKFYCAISADFHPVAISANVSKWLLEGCLIDRVSHEEMQRVKEARGVYEG